MPEASSPDAPGRADRQDPDWLPPELNTGVAHSARVYDYWLGGKDNFAADRALGDAIIAAMPLARFAARANRAFLGRAVRYLAVDAGIELGAQPKLRRSWPRQADPQPHIEGGREPTLSALRGILPVE